MREIDFESQFDCVLLLFTSFGYFEDFENDLVLQKIVRALKPNGKVVLDIQNRDRFVEKMTPFIVTEKDGNLMVDRITYDEASRRMYNRRIMIRDGMRRDKPFFIRLYNLDEITYSLQRAGMTITQAFGDWDGSPVTRDSNRLIILAQKPG
jgi:SAM-dependent methyltransferase